MVLLSELENATSDPIGPPPYQLRDSYAKIERADEHLGNLALEISAFAQRNPYAAFMDAAIKNRPRGVIDNLSDDAEMSTKRFGIIAGEIAHHLRSALNHLLWELIRANKRVDPASINKCKRFEFPIFINPEEYKPGHGRKIQGVSDSARTRIEAAQPYNGAGEDDPLWIVNNLDIQDKHHVLLVAGGIAVDPTNGIVHFWQSMNYGAIMGIRHPTMNVDPNGTLNVAFPKFGVREYQPIIPSLTHLSEGVRMTIDKFRDLF